MVEQDMSDAVSGWSTRPSEPPSLRQPLVWILDDSRVQGAAVAKTLAELFEIRLFIDSPSLLEALSQQQPEVLVLDWHLPDVSGLDLLRIARESYDEVTLPVLVLTASGDDAASDLLEALGAGANDYAKKPFVDAELRARVATLARVRLLHERARRAEREHQQALRALEEKAAFEQQLIGIVSHDLRTPISAIALGASLLVEDTELPERHATIASRIVSSAGRAARMLGDLLDFTAIRVGSGLPISPCPMELHQITRKILAEVQMAHPLRNVELRQNNEADGTWDADRIAQVIANLTTNALHYSPADTQVTIEIGATEEWAYFSVHNVGAPISDQLMEKLFLPMHRGPDGSAPSRRSVGLGLFIVDNIVRAHGGHIEVNSSHTEGTTFAVQLPRTSNAQQA